jgi:hypothetical protein
MKINRLRVCSIPAAIELVRICPNIALKNGLAQFCLFWFTGCLGHEEQTQIAIEDSYRWLKSRIITLAILVQPSAQKPVSTIRNRSAGYLVLTWARVARDRQARAIGNAS